MKKKFWSSFLHSFFLFLTVIAGDGIYTCPHHKKTMSIEENATVRTAAWANIIQFYTLCYICSDIKVEAIPKSN